MKANQLDSDEKRRMIVDAADDKKANYVTTLNLRDKTLIADYFIICSGTSNVHIRSIADGIMEAMQEREIHQSALEVYSDGAWVLLDYGDVVVHIMSEEHRSFYKLESLWGTAAEASQEAPPSDSALPADAPAQQRARTLTRRPNVRLQPFSWQPILRQAAGPTPSSRGELAGCPALSGTSAPRRRGQQLGNGRFSASEAPGRSGRSFA